MNPESGSDGRTPPFSALFWQCLAKAYLPPCEETFFRALRDDWPRLLGEIASRVGLSLQPDIDAISKALHEIEGSQDLLVTYSRLFLVPPVVAPLNLGVYLDISKFGGSALALDALYREYGLASSSDVLKDNPDHLARVIEFLGFLFAKNAEACGSTQSPAGGTGYDLTTLRTNYLLRALTEMIRRTADAETAHQLPCVYSRILSLTLSAVRDHDGVLFEESIVHPAEAAGVAAVSAEAAEIVNCSECGSPIIAASEMHVIADRLRMAGLPVDHLQHCPDCRDAGRGWQRGQISLGIPGIH
jgi:TorA maturation chaperone TorD